MFSLIVLVALVAVASAQTKPNPSEIFTAKVAAYIKDQVSHDARFVWTRVAAGFCLVLARLLTRGSIVAQGRPFAGDGCANARRYRS